MKSRSGLSAVPAAVLIIAVLVLSPFMGGKDTLYGSAGLAILVMLAAAALLWCRQFGRPVAIWPFMVFLAFTAASAAITASLHATIQQILFFTSCAALALTASSVFRENKWFTAAVLAFVGTGLVLGAMGVAEYVEQYRLSGHGWRVFTTFVSPGYFGGYLVIVIPMILAVFLSGRSSAVVLGSGLALGFATAAMFLTGTRFAVYSTAGGLFVFAALALWSHSIEKRQIARVGAVIVILAVSAVLASTPTMNRIRGEQAEQQSYSGTFRIATWRGSINIVRANPILGTGAGTFELVFPRYMVAGYTRNAHNGYLQIASEAGIPALVAVAAAFLTLLIAGIRGLKHQEEDQSQLLLPNGRTILMCGLAASLFGSLARNLLDSDLYNPGIALPFWILAGLLASRSPRAAIINPRAAVKIILSALLGAAVVIWLLFIIGQVKSDEGDAAMMDGDMISAIESYHSAVAIDPLKAGHWLELGKLVAVTSRGDEDQWEEGLDHIRRAIRLEPTRAKNVITLGRLYALRGDNRNAIKQFLRALGLDPHATSAMLAAARLMEQSESTQKQAEEMYQRLLDEEDSPFERLRGVPEMVNPDYAWAHHYFGQKYLAEGRYDDAAQEFHAAIDRLELRKSYKLFRDAAEAAGMVDPQEEEALDTLLEDCKSALTEAESK